MFRVAGIMVVFMTEVSAVTLRLGLSDDFGRALGERIDFAEVVEVEVDGSRIGSGVVIDEHWILTAGHVVEGSRSAVIRSGSREWIVSEITTHPGWSPNPSTGYSQGADLALLRLDRGLPGVPIVPLWTGGTTARPLAMMAGYGAGGNGLLGAYQSPDGLQAGLNLVDRFLPAGAGGFGSRISTAARIVTIP
jgi:hypothetical protein